MMLSEERMGPSSSSSAATQMASGPLFTSTSVPSTPGLAGSCQLPLGCVISAFAESGAGNGQQNALISADAHRIEDGKASMNICLSCLSHINPYCQYETSNNQWTCSVCGYEDNIISDPAIFADNSANSPLISNVVEYVQRAADADCGAGGCAYVFVVDGHIPSAEVRSVLHTIRSIFEREKSLIGSRNGVIGLIIFGKTVSIYQLGLRAGLASADVYPASSSLLDGSDTSILEERAYLAGVDSGLDALERCLDAHFDLASDETVTGTAPSSSSGGIGAPTSRREMLRQRREERLRREARSADVGSRVGSSKATGKRSNSSSARQMRRKRRSERKKNRCTGAAINMAINLISASSEEHELETGRILLFTNGCCNHGPGSVVAPIMASSTDENQHTANHSRAAALPASPSRKGSPRRQRRSAGDIIDPVAMAEASEFFQLLGKDAFETDCIGIDCFVGGSTNVGMPAYLALSGPSDGYCMTYETFSGEEAAANLRHVLERTHVSNAGSNHQRASIPNTHGEDGTRLHKLTGCILDIRCSPFISPHSVVGPGSVEYDDERTVIANEQGSYAHGAQRAAAIGLPTSGLPSKDMLSGTLTRLRLGRFDGLATHTLVMQVNDDIHPEDDHAVFQFVARFATPDGNHIVTRVFNHRLPVRDTRAFVEGLQGNVVSLVLGREAVHRATSGRGSTGEEEVAVLDRDRDDELANDARKDIDATIHLASAAYRLLGSRAGNDSDRSLSASSLDFAFPPELADGLRTLYSLRRGPLLGTGPQQSPDDRCASRSLFMRLPLSDCLPTMSPTVWCCRANANKTAQGFSLEPVPAVTLALWHEAIVVNMLLWGCESWAIQSKEVQALRVFQFRCLLTILKINVMHKISRATILEMCQVQDIIQTMDLRRARWIEKPSHMDFTRCPRLLFGCWMYGRVHHRDSKPLKTIGHSHTDSLKRIGEASFLEGGAAATAPFVKKAGSITVAPRVFPLFQLVQSEAWPPMMEKCLRLEPGTCATFKPTMPGQIPPRRSRPVAVIEPSTPSNNQGPAICGNCRCVDCFGPPCLSPLSRPPFCNSCGYRHGPSHDQCSTTEAVIAEPFTADEVEVAVNDFASPRSTQSVERTTMSPMINALTNATIASVLVATVEEDTEATAPTRTTRSQSARLNLAATFEGFVPANNPNAWRDRDLE